MPGQILIYRLRKMAFNESRKIKAHRLKVEKALKEFIPVMGADAQTFFTKSFANQGFTDTSLQKWQPRKRTRVRGRDDSTRAILVKTGRLRKSLRRVNKGFKAIVIKTNVPYAVFHNEGTKRLPKRQFVGHSRKLIDSLKVKLNEKIKNAFR